jgi:6,7-dimethyl-8-ribityllumazine synthase
MKVIRGRVVGEGLKVSVVVARFNEDVTGQLLEEALAALREKGVKEEGVEVIHVPGAFELPGTCARLVARGGIDGIIALGCVIRGETPHFDFVAGEAARGLATLSIEATIPVVFGVLTTETLEQAMLRAGGGERNAGRDAAHAVLEMADVYGWLG